MIDINALSVFLAVAKYGSFSEAGRQLNLSQPSVSQTIHSLERSFGVELFTRQGRAVRLTEAGSLLQAMGKELVVSANRLEEVMQSVNGTVAGDVTVGCSTTSGKYLLPSVIARFRRIYPQVHINVMINSRKNVLKMLLEAQIPFGVSSKKIEHADIEYKHFYTDDILLIVPANHRWASFRRILPEDLLDEPLLLREETAGTTEVLFEGLQEHDISPDMLHVEMVLGNTEAIEMAVEEGIGVAFVSRLAAEKGLALGKIVEISVEGINLSRPIYIARNRRSPATRTQAEFWEFVKIPSESPIAEG